MLVGIFQFLLLIPASESLKEKRFVIKSIKDKLQNKFNISIAEVDELDKWQKATLGISIVANEKKIIEQTFTRIFNFLDDHDQVEILDHQKEII